LPGCQRDAAGTQCVDDDELLDTAHALAMKAADGPRELVITVKETLAAMATIGSHDEAVSRELTPQVWSTQKPWFRERIAALQSKISSKS
jgi:enoyl-CoA hydratase